MEKQWPASAAINPLENEDALFGLFEVDNEEYDELHVQMMPRLVDVGGIVICLDGECEMIVNERRLTVRRGDMLTVFPKTIIQGISKSDDLRAYAIAVNIEFLRSLNISSISELYVMIKDTPCISLTDVQIDTVMELCEILRRNGGNADHHFRKEIGESLLLTLCYEIANIYCSRRNIVKQPLSRKDILLQRFLSLVSTDYLVSREVSYYADKLCVTPKYLSIVVRSASGRSATDWIAHMVIINAKSMLVGSRMTVQQISAELNFPNSSFFGQYFRRHTGKTPNAYRKSAR